MSGTLDGPLSDQMLDRLRTSSAMTLAVPQLALKLRADDVVCLEVRRSPVPDAQHLVLPPCAFHRAVARAFAMRRSGERIAMRGVPVGCEPAIDWGVAPGAAILAGGVVRVADDGQWHHVAAVLGSEDLVARALDGAPGLDGRRIECLQVTLVHATTTRGDKTASRGAVGAIHDLMARVGVEDLEQRLGLAPAAGAARARR